MSGLQELVLNDRLASGTFLLPCILIPNILQERELCFSPFPNLRILKLAVHAALGGWLSEVFNTLPRTMEHVVLELVMNDRRRQQMEICCPPGVRLQIVECWEQVRSRRCLVGEGLGSCKFSAEHG